MILTIDIGNTNIVFSGYPNAGKQSFSVRHATEVNKTSDQYGLFLLNQLQRHGIPLIDIKNVVVASVVPQLNFVIRMMSQDYFGVKAEFIGDQDLKIPLNIKIDFPHTLGADRIASSIAAIVKYHKRVILIDCGTATTIDAIGDDRDFIGGVIAPGIMTSIKSLHKSTALLPIYNFQKPNKVLATNTEDALHAGIFYGAIGMIERIVKEMKKELPSGGSDYKVVAIGGLSKVFEKYADFVDIFDEDLTSLGLYHIYLHNK